MKHVLAYFECLVKNIFTRIALITLVLGIASLFLNIRFSYDIAGVLIGCSLAVFTKTKFGMISFRMYQRALDHMISYGKQPDLNFSYCCVVGESVAQRVFKKYYPEKYNRMIENHGLIDFSDIQIGVYAFIIGKLVLLLKRGLLTFLITVCFLIAMLIPMQFMSINPLLHIPKWAMFIQYCLVHMSGKFGLLFLIIILLVSLAIGMIFIAVAIKKCRDKL